MGQLRSRSGVNAAPQFLQLRLAWRQGMSKRRIQLFVAPEFDFAAVFPTKDDAFLIDDDKAAGDETRADKFFFSDLTFALECSQAGSPGSGSGRHIIIARNFHCLHLVPSLLDSDDFVEMTRIVTYPLAG